MLTPGEHKTVQARILEYAEAEGALLGQFRHLHTDIYGNRKFVEHLRNREPDCVSDHATHN
jgi:hypothetical protein